MPASAAQRYTKAVAEVLDLEVDCTDYLDGDTITGTPTATVSPTGPTLGTPTVNTGGTQSILGRTVAVNKAVTVRISGGTAGVEYEVRILFVTTTGGQTRQARNILVEVVAT